MNPSEKQFISKHLTELLDLIRPSVHSNAYLESQGLLNKEEQQKIDSVSTEIGRARELINTLTTKNGGFQALYTALEKTGQTGAVEILKKHDSEAPASQPIGSGSQPKVPEPEASTTTMNRADNVQVGSPDCGIPTLVKIIQKNPVSHAFLGDLSDFARDLDIVASKRKKILKSDDSDEEKLESVLEEWTKANSSKATLGSLLRIIRGCNANSIADDIVKAFRVTEHTL